MATGFEEPHLRLINMFSTVVRGTGILPIFPHFCILRIHVGVMRVGYCYGIALEDRQFPLGTSYGNGVRTTWEGASRTRKQRGTGGIHRHHLSSQSVNVGTKSAPFFDLFCFPHPNGIRCPSSSSFPPSLSPSLPPSHLPGTTAVEVVAKIRGHVLSSQALLSPSPAHFVDGCFNFFSRIVMDTISYRHEIPSMVSIKTKEKHAMLLNPDNKMLDSSLPWSYDCGHA